MRPLDTVEGHLSPIEDDDDDGGGDGVGNDFSVPTVPARSSSVKKPSFSRAFDCDLKTVQHKKKYISIYILKPSLELQPLAFIEYAGSDVLSIKPRAPNCP